MTDMLAERARGGDGDAFTKLFSEVSEEVYRVAYIYVKNSDDARDVVQETAYRCFKGIKSLRDVSLFRTWAVKTAINCSLDILKSRKRTLPIEECTVLPAADSPSPERAAIAAATLDQIMNKMNEREKSVIILRHLYGLSLEEIAKTLKIPLSTAKSTLYRAAEKIKRSDFNEERDS